MSNLTDSIWTIRSIYQTVLKPFTSYSNNHKTNVS